ncbi:MAG: hypothetical protein HY308_19790 [Gammaproteobacteria bacterium]|nr:hypothetical protein [Gammaproteobacteria bacterium]
MRRLADASRGLDSVVLLFLFGLFLLFSPFTFWWAAHARVWYLPYLLWLGFIALIAIVSWHYRHEV